MVIKNLKYFGAHFTPSEFDSPDKVGSGQQMDVEFITLLSSAREIAQIPFYINSGFRTKTHNKHINGKPDSSHLIGLACDINCTSSRSRFLILNALLQVGFTRIGVHKSFIHVDLDRSKTDSLLWLY